MWFHIEMNGCCAEAYYTQFRWMAPRWIIAPLRCRIATLLHPWFVLALSSPPAPIRAPAALIRHPAHHPPHGTTRYPCNRFVAIPTTRWSWYAAHRAHPPLMFTPAERGALIEAPVDGYLPPRRLEFTTHRGGRFQRHHVTPVRPEWRNNDANLWHLFIYYYFEEIFHLNELKCICGGRY